MIPLQNSLPYDIQMNEVFATHCPFCGQDHVPLPLKPEDVSELRGGRRKMAIVFPCCRTRIQLVDADSDYLMADRALKRR
ncbi:hypothetical protein [Cohnella thailandensis]|uniref:Uncharacterized protein n=1 Tax=Cohnella thailandensis TaxID=557557 RepID=A0A841SVS2_9BACL|nr:hypothetical protein [Cohnella thailandensis]MBB6632801.1 hypothetical protein [Cohnella thailandensis]MBP1975507.1 hypothetical protein [Cohnella thailandensis]